MNTRLTYLYRDASNYKQWHEVVLAGEADAEAIRASLWEGEYFIPQAVGFPALQERFAAQGYEFPTEDDHPWHEIAGIEPTEDSPTRGIYTDEIMQGFTQAAARGWGRNLCNALS